MPRNLNGIQFKAVTDNYPTDYTKGTLSEGHSGLNTTIVAHHNGRRIGELTSESSWDSFDMKPDPDKGTLFEHEHKPPKIDLTEVADEYQRRGVASHMKAIADDLHGEPIEHSDKISGPAYAWASATGGQVQTEGPTGNTWSVPSYPVQPHVKAYPDARLPAPQDPKPSRFKTDKSEQQKLF